VLIGGIAAVVVVAVVVAVALLTRRSQDDAHSVEHYHRQLHTLEEIRAHPTMGAGAGAGAGASENGTDAGATPAAGAAAGENGSSHEAYPASAFRVSGSRTVRLTDRETPPVPPAPPPAVPNPAEPVKFDDTAASPLPRDGVGGEVEGEGQGPPEVPHGSFMRADDDKAMHAIDHRPRRLGAPLAAIGVVTVLIIVLIVTGLHSDTKAPRHGPSTTATTTTGHASTTVPAHGGTPAGGHGHRPHTTTTTTTTAPPAVSAATAPTPHSATYDVAAASYSLSLAASAGECWVEAENPATGTVLYSGTLFTGQSHIVAASGPVVVIAGAPGAFAATVNGVPVNLPSGFQAPFTLTFQTPGAAGAGSGAATTTTPTT
jgi:hypothetical protein